MITSVDALFWLDVILPSLLIFAIGAIFCWISEKTVDNELDRIDAEMEEEERRQYENLCARPRPKNVRVRLASDKGKNDYSTIMSSGKR